VSADSDAGDISFPRAARLLSPRQFQATFSQGRRISTAVFRLHAHLRGSEDAVEMSGQKPAVATKAIAKPKARLGISVPKRVAAHAIERNRIRRIARESFRHQRQHLPPGDYVLVAQREAALASPSALRESLSTLWRRVNALMPPDAAPTMPIPATGPADSNLSFPPPRHR
jgi:ribonuclease P protein component